MAQVTAEGDADPRDADPHVECLFRRIELAREIGRPARVARLIGELDRRLAPAVAGADRERLEAARKWLAWATAYEAANGPGSLLDRSHPSTGGRSRKSPGWLAFARRVAGSAHAFEEEAHRLLIVEETRRAYDPGGSARQIAAMAVTGDRRPRLATITAPTLVIHGADVPLLLPECGRDTWASIRNADLTLIDGMGHDLPPALHRPVVEAINPTARRSFPPGTFARSHRS